MMRIRFLPLAILAALAGCGHYPNDVEATHERVEASRSIRLGIVPLPETATPVAQAYLQRLARATGATVEPPRSGSTEELFALLDGGKLDLVIAEVAEDSPWLTQVAVIEPLAERRLGERRLGLSPVARNGENRWIMLLEREARDMRGPKS